MSAIWKQWRIAVGLIGLCLIPVAAGANRVIQIFSRIPVTVENARFMNAPVPAVLHIVSVSVFCVLGAFQFVPSFRNRNLPWHRLSGRYLIIFGLTASLTGLWLTQFYAWPVYDGFSLYIVRLIVGTGMTWSLIAGYAAVRRGDRKNHRRWMMRAYALGMGAGTQVLTHIPWFLLPQYHSEMFRTICMAAGWGINLGFVEWMFYRPHRNAE